MSDNFFLKMVFAVFVHSWVVAVVLLLSFSVSGFLQLLGFLTVGLLVLIAWVRFFTEVGSRRK